MDGLIKWLEQHMAPCFYKKFFNVECPGCGMQRSFLELIKGNFYESFMLYPALSLIIFLILLLIAHLIFDFKHGAKLIKWLFILNAVIIVISFIIKQTQGSEACCPH